MGEQTAPITNISNPTSSDKHNTRTVPTFARSWFLYRPQSGCVFFFWFQLELFFFNKNHELMQIMPGKKRQLINVDDDSDDTEDNDNDQNGTDNDDEDGGEDSDDDGDDEYQYYY